MTTITAARRTILEPVIALPRLRPIRERRLLTIRALAALAGVSKTTIVNVEHGSTAVQPETVRKLATALQVEPTDLMARQRRA